MTSIEPIIGLSLLNCIFPVFHESLRGGWGTRFDFLRAASLSFVICYGLVPFCHALLLDDILLLAYNPNILVFSDNEQYAMGALLIGLLGYLSLLSGYYLSRQMSPVIHSSMSTTLSPRFGIRGGYVLCLIALTAFSAILMAYGGITEALTIGPSVRSGLAIPGSSSGKVIFLIHFAKIAFISSHLFYAVLICHKHRLLERIIVTLGLLLTLIISLLVILMQSGRLMLVFYLSCFVLIHSEFRRRLRLWQISIVAFSLFFLATVGKTLFLFFYDWDLTVSTFSTISSDVWKSILSAVVTMSFPYEGLRLAIANLPDVVNYRFFIDLPLAFIHLLPERLLGIPAIPTIGAIHEATYFGTLPQEGSMAIDSITVGFYSLGTIGVIVWMSLFGTVIRFLTKFFEDRRSDIAITFKAELIVFTASSFTYGIPTDILFKGFPILVSAIVLRILSHSPLPLRSVREYVPDPAPPSV